MSLINNDGWLILNRVVLEPATAIKQKSKPHAFRAIVVHRTGTPRAQSTLNMWNNPGHSGSGTHFLVAETGIIYQVISLHKTTVHIGKTNNVSYIVSEKRAVGIEVSGAPTVINTQTGHIYDPPAANVQGALNWLVDTLRVELNICAEDVYAHGAISSHKGSNEGVPSLHAYRHRN